MIASRCLTGAAAVALLAACSSGSAPTDVGMGGGVQQGMGGSAAPPTAGAAGQLPSAGQAAGGSGGAVMSGGGGSAGGAGAPIRDCAPPAAVPVTVPWKAISTQPAAFYGTDEARVLADNILYYQNDDRGWPKNTDMTSRTAPRAGSTIDNRATTTQIELLARVFSATGCADYRDAALGGIGFLLDAQYDNGGWPQEYPNPEGYHKHITFNDDAMVHVLQVLGGVAQRNPPYAFVDDALKAVAGEAVQKGVACILGCQIEMDGGQRGWCAQHDEVTLEPAAARTYELPSVSGSEGARIVRYLMTIDPPTPEIRAAVEGAVAWFEAVKLTGIRVEATMDASQPTGEDRVVVADPNAPPLWARFYELGTNRPIFSSRCEVSQCEADPFYMRRYSLAEIDNERRVGYAWYGDWPAAALVEYAAWKKRYP